MNQPSPLVARLAHAMQRRGINARELALQAGVGPSFVYDILNGNSRNPTAAKLAAISEILGVGVGWLLEGEEPGLPDGMVTIPPLAVDMRSGLVIASPESTAPWRFHRSWVQQELGIPAERLRVFEPRDDAMAPTLQEGDTVLVDTGAAIAQPDGVYVIVDRLGLALRRVSTEGEKLKLTPDNNIFSTELLPTSDVRLIGKVVWSARKFV